MSLLTIIKDYRRNQIAKKIEKQKIKDEYLRKIQGEIRAAEKDQALLITQKAIYDASAQDPITLIEKATGIQRITREAEAQLLLQYSEIKATDEQRADFMSGYKNPPFLSKLTPEKNKLYITFLELLSDSLQSAFQRRFDHLYVQGGNGNSAERFARDSILVITLIGQSALRVDIQICRM